MRREKIQEIIVIRENNAGLFQEQVNKALENLAHEDIEPDLSITVNPLTAVIKFTRTEFIAENETDKKALQGHRVMCKNCAYFEYGQNDRVGYCDLKSRQVYADRFACSHIEDGDGND